MLLGDVLDEGDRRSVIKRIELLPFHRMADHKYEKMNWNFPSQIPQRQIPMRLQPLANYWRTGDFLFLL